jgi:conflict system STAND superfamily ATPase/restriction endonuclease
MRQYESFSPYDFELFVADLLSAELGVRYETFPRGGDGGIDLRHIPKRKRRPDVVQCKHYPRSTFSALLTAAKKEAKHLKDMSPRPSRYRFVTSRPLTAANKGRIKEVLHPWIESERDILGVADLDMILDKHPDVERRQVKLWLTGGTQLAALLKAGSIHRSQALIEEINAAMPRYVQGHVFAEARERLREQRVLVIAGIPGIGKTTLARMLLADAVMDGYEPIEVSLDIEEGWSALDPATKQVFLYDDFLGRTALSERFSKNEDQRLVDFMHRTSRSPSSLFVLTTREYILKQATDLYERLSAEGLDSDRFLLALPDYTLLDRARIFANHIYHSARLTRPFREALIVDGGYKKIISHRNYSPRTIELITGLAKRWDESVTPDSYLAYALNTLQHPTLIWKSAFERELDDYGRALALVLATLPRRTGLTPAEAAFGALCDKRELPLNNRAFERTLSRLDDSFVTTSQPAQHFPIEDDVVVEPYDPSVIDFLVAFLHRSPGDVEELADGCLFFEQAEWLYDTFGKDAKPAVGVAIRRALQRTYPAKAITLVSVPVGPRTWTYRPFGTGNVERRLLVIHREAQRGSELYSWWREQFLARLQNWAQGEGEPESTMALLKALSDTDSIDITEAAVAARKVLSEGRSYMLSLEWLLDLRREFPAAFGREEWDTHVAEFDEWLKHGLSDVADDMSDLDELAQVERMVELYGLELDDEVWNDAEESVRRRVEERDAEIEDDRAYERPELARDAAYEQRQIDALFSGLAE